MNKLYHIVYAADDTEEYYHNEVWDQQKRILQREDNGGNLSQSRFIICTPSMLLKI